MKKLFFSMAATGLLFIGTANATEGHHSGITSVMVCLAMMK